MNLLYFGLFFISLFILSIFRLISIDAPAFFWVTAGLEALLETALVFTIGVLVQRFRWLFWFFTGVLFLVLLVHFADFMMLKVMDTSLGYFFQYVFSSDLKHVFVGLQAINLNAGFWFLIVAAIVLVPLVGMFVYRMIDHMVRTCRREVTLKTCSMSVALLLTTLSVLNLTTHPSLSPLHSQKFHQSLPLNLSLFTPPTPLISLPPLSLPRNETTVQQQLTNLSLATTHLPNIYLFVIESLRKDFVDAQTAPHLTAFAEEHISFPESFANSNSTHTSWFSIFHATYPHHWTAMQSSWNEGSVPLQVLKKLGYQVKVYSSADLGLFGIDSLLFGKDRKLLSSVEEYSKQLGMSPAERDAKGFAALTRDLKHREGTVFVVFLDATHSEYSVPNDFVPKFLPIVDKIDYFNLNKETLEPVKNRYRNAISYVDGLFGKFFGELKALGLYDEAVVAVTGDHGEEFLEEGALFHGTHLNRWQTSVPLFLKLGEKKAKVGVATHVDVFPSVLHHVTGRSDWGSFVDGKSVLMEEKGSFRLCVLHNGASTPCEFTIEREGQRLHVRCPKGENIYEAREWEVLEK